MREPDRVWVVRLVSCTGGTRYSGFLLVAGVSFAQAGGAVALLAATGLTTIASTSGGAQLTGAYLAVGLLLGSMSVSMAPNAAARFGLRRAFLVCNAVLAFGWLIAGVAVAAGLPSVQVLFAVAAIVGPATALASTLAPLVYRDYLRSENLATAFAHMTVAKGVAWGVGSLIGGMVLSAGSAELGLVLAGVMKLPLVIVLAVRAPRHQSPGRRTSRLPWRDGVTSLRRSPQLRAVALQAVGMGLFVGPFLLMVVPISQSLRQQDLYVGAGFLMASFAVGELLSPLVVRKFRRGRTTVEASASAVLLTGVTVAVFGSASLLFPPRAELAAWALVGVTTAMFRFAAQALGLDTAASALAPDQSTTNLATVRLIGGLATPAGLLAWGALLDLVGAAALAVVGGCALLAISLTMGQLVRRQASGLREGPAVH